MWSYPKSRHTHIHTIPQCSRQACPSLSPPLVTVKRRQPSSGKPRVNLYCIYWRARCILLFICPCGWNSICALCKAIKLSLSRRYFWRHLHEQLKLVCGEIAHVNWGVQRQEGSINQVTQPSALSASILKGFVVAEVSWVFFNFFSTSLLMWRVSVWSALVSQRFGTENFTKWPQCEEQHIIRTKQSTMLPFYRLSNCDVNPMHICMRRNISICLDGPPYVCVVVSLCLPAMNWRLFQCVPCLLPMLAGMGSSPLCKPVWALGSRS